jgi:hypothetical protein
MAEEAVGRVSHELLQTTFPEELAIIEARLHADKQWRGRLGHIRKMGAGYTTKVSGVFGTLMSWLSRIPMLLIV